MHAATTNTAWCNVYLTIGVAPEVRKITEDNVTSGVSQVRVTEFVNLASTSILYWYAFCSMPRGLMQRC